MPGIRWQNREPSLVQAMLRYPLCGTYLPPGVRKGAGDPQPAADRMPAIQCDHIYALLSTH